MRPRTWEPGRRPARYRDEGGRGVRGEDPDMDALEDIAGGEEEGGKKSRLNSAVAIAVVILASFMAVSKVKDDNIVQAMLQAQAQEVDAWNQFQAKSTKQHLSEVTLDQLRLHHATAHLTPAAERLFREREAHYAAEVARYEAEKNKIAEAARSHHKEYDQLNLHDDQFDLSDAVLSLALALFGITALTQKRWLYWVAVVLGVFGLFVGFAG